MSLRPEKPAPLTGGLPDPLAGGLSVRNVAGGYLQNRDNGHVGAGDLTCVTKRQPSAQEMADLRFAGPSPNM